MAVAPAPRILDYFVEDIIDSRLMGVGKWRVTLMAPAHGLRHREKFIMFLPGQSTKSSKSSISQESPLTKLPLQLQPVANGASYVTITGATIRRHRYSQ